MAHPAGSDDATGSAVAADDGGGRDEVSGRRAGDLRTPRWAALGGAARSERLRPAAPLRRRAVLGRAAFPAAPAGGQVAAHPRLRRRLRRQLGTYPGAASLVVAVTGSSGLVGSALVALLSTGGHRVIRLVRRTPRNGGERQWDPQHPAPGLLDGVDAVVHLAGESIAGRFTDAHQTAIRASRIEPTRRLAELAGRTAGLRAFVSASAIGYYGFDRGDALLSEESMRGDGFLADVVADWEAATAPASDAGLRVALVRTGIVQAANGGTLRLMRPLFLAGYRSRRWDRDFCWGSGVPENWRRPISE